MANLLWLNMNQRQIGREAMDEPGFSGETLHTTFRQLEWINKLLGNHYSVRGEMLGMLKNTPVDKTVRVVDIGCGGGDTVHSLFKWGKRRGLNLEFVGIDKNPNTIEYARSRTNNNRAFQFIEADVKSPEFTLPDCDILLSSHFVYHFNDPELSQFLERNLHHVSRGVIFSELRRSRLSYWLFLTLGSILFFGQHTLHDGLAAIRSAFTPDEFESVMHPKWPETKVKAVPFFRICVTLITKTTT